MPNEEPIQIAPVEWSAPGLGVRLNVQLHRMDRGRCSRCNKRRVRYWVGVDDGILPLAGPPMCAKCAGLR